MGFWSRITGGSTSHDGAHQGQRPLLEPGAFSSAIHKLHGLPHMDWRQVRNIISDRLEPELAGAAVACAVRSSQWFGIQRFWSGSGFNLKGGQRPSYQLSEVMVRSLMTGRGRNGLFKKFLLHAHRRDAGEQAARQFLNVGVGDLAAEFLGSGPWSPLPTTESDK